LESSIVSHIERALADAERDIAQGWYTIADHRLREARAWADTLKDTHLDDRAADSLTTLIDVRRAAVRARCQSIVRRPGAFAPRCPT
jgi:CRP-like cAMP-binding protein